MLPAMAIAIREAATYDQLLIQWQAQGWSQIRNSVLNQVPVGISSGHILIHTQLDAFEWTDVSAFGIGLTGDAVSQMAAYIKQAGSQLHAYALFSHVDFDLLGIKRMSYRLLLYHSQVQLGVAALAILAAAFAAAIFLQYIATGEPPVQSIQQLWAGIVKPVQDGASGVISGATGSISTVYILGIAVAGAIAIAFGQAGKATGTKISPPKGGPGGSVGVRAGGVSARVTS